VSPMGSACKLLDSWLSYISHRLDWFCDLNVYAFAKAHKDSFTLKL
jgi:hypothetical protein